MILEGSGRLLQSVVNDAEGKEKSAEVGFQIDHDVTGERIRFDLGIDGQYAVIHAEQRAEAWNLAQQQRVLAIQPPPNCKFICVRVSPDGNWLAASYRVTSDTEADRLQLYEMKSGELKHDAAMDRGHGFSKSIAFSHDSNLVAYGAEGLAMFRMPAFDRYLFPPGDAIKCVAFSPDNQLLAFVPIRGTVNLWSPVASQKIATLAHPREPGTELRGESVMFSRDGRLLASLKLDSVKVWNLRGSGERIVFPGHDGGVPSLAFSPDDSIMASSSKDGTVRLWSTATGQVLRAPLDLAGPVQGIVFSPDGKWLATADGSASMSEPQTLNVWRTSDYEKDVIAHQLVGKDGNHALCATAFSPNGKYLAACGNGMCLWSTTAASAENGDFSLVKVKELEGADSLFVTFSPDSGLVAWADQWDKVRFWDIDGEMELRSDARMHQGWHGLAFVDGGVAFVGRNGAVEVWDPRTNRMSFPLGEAGEFQSPHIAASPDGAYLAGVHAPETVALWDVRAQRRLFLFRPERSEIWSLAFNSKGTKLGVGLSDGGVAVWDLKRINQALGELELSWCAD